jgi:hypothetical protein
MQVKCKLFFICFTFYVIFRIFAPRNQYHKAMNNILRLKEVLKEKGVTGKELAQRLGMTETSISRMLNGLQYPKIETLLNIATALNVDIRDLFKSTANTTATPIYMTNDKGDFVECGALYLQPQSTSPERLQE